MDNTMDSNEIINIKYFSIADAINATIQSRTVFIIANERLKTNGEIGRYFTVFPNFKTFLAKREKYKHCHEIFIDHVNNKPNPAGRLVFDFDIKKDEVDEIPDDFKDIIELTILDVIETYYDNVNTDIIEFVWSTSTNPKKFSKHLTVKNLYFDDWISMCKIFYQLFCIIWDQKYLWISSDKLIDFQIVRKNTSLRMVGSSKIDGYPLVFDDPKHKLTDSLIRIYFRNQREKEQLITRKNINKNVFENVLIDDSTESFEYEQFYHIDLNPKKAIAPFYESDVYDKAFEIVNIVCPEMFRIGKINGQVMTLIRKKPGKCILSDRFHEHENAFVVISITDDSYFIRFGCFRFCSKYKTILIGTATRDNLIITTNSNFVPLAKTRKKYHNS